VKSTTRIARPVVTADGAGIVSHAGAALLRELADEAGLTAGWTDALLGTYKGTPVHLPGRVLTDLAVTLADGGDCLADLAALRDQAALFGPVASHPTAYRVLDRVGASQLDALRTARAQARARVWAAGGGPDLTGGAGVVLDVDASLVTAHREGRRRRDLQARLRVPSAAGLPGSPGRKRRGGPGRDAAPWQRGQQHWGVSDRLCKGLTFDTEPLSGSGRTSYDGSTGQHAGHCGDGPAKTRQGRASAG